MSEHPTDTSQWALAVHRVAPTTAEIWVGTLFAELTKPQRARVVLEFPDGRRRTREIRFEHWEQPFRRINKRFYTVVRFEGLTPRTHYTVSFHRRIEADPEIDRQQSWQHLRSGAFDTLPERIPGPSDKPFTIGLGSCYYHHRDEGKAADAYQALYERGSEELRPEVTFLTGDQVYLDIGFDSLSRDPQELRERIANDYATYWRLLGGILNRGGTWMLPDDHEYWNDYPFYDTLIPTLQALRLDQVRAAWTDAARDGVQNVQRSPVVEILSFGEDLSICLADLRSFRKHDRFLSAADFDRLVAWAEGLEGPGVLVTSQPLVVDSSALERNLLSFPGQYRRLVEALASTGHDIVLLSGDVHFGRIAVCPLGRLGARLIEVISSPLSNLTHLDGVATATPGHKPQKFPHPKGAVQGWQRVPVTYLRSFEVDTLYPGLAYPKMRTREHFMTVAFARAGDGRVEMMVRAWRVRDRIKNRDLPRQDFGRPFEISLK